MVTEVVDYVVGVDTHRDEHTLALIEAASGAVLAQRAVASNGRGYAQALRFAQQQADGARLWALEGAGHYGAGLARYLSERGETVLEVSRSPRGERRLRGKDDQLDAVRAARAALTSEPLPRPRSGAHREALRLLLLARRSAVDVRREALVQLRSVIVTAPDGLRDELRRLPLQGLLERCSRLRRSSGAAPDELAARLVLRTLARRIEAATVEADELEGEILAHVRALAPPLLEEPGVGPIVAAQLLVAWSHRGRVHSEAAFARLAGVAPLPASSGQTRRHRLSRGGDRQLNRALHTVVLHRRQHDPATKDYIAKRIAEGKSHRDATRLLKRYLARSLYRLLQNQEPLMA
ncbi:MAG TPA: IS110 family transposase [Thermoanaerobaculia bacterium]|jgi:transposase|nr:IS110 family transposase [Thermoanaerobaculia bacterium]